MNSSSISKLAACAAMLSAVNLVSAAPTADHSMPHFFGVRGYPLGVAAALPQAACRRRTRDTPAQALAPDLSQSDLCDGLSSRLCGFARGNSSPALRQGKPADTLSGRDPAAVALRDRVLKAYRDLRGIREKVTQKQWKTDKEEALTLDIEFRFRKPNRLYLSIDYPYVEKSGRWQLVYASDGKTLTVYNGARNDYQVAKSPARLDRLILPQALRGPEFIALLRDANPFEELEKLAVVRYGELFEESPQGSWRTLKLDLQQDGAKRALRYLVGPKDNLIHGMTLSIVPDEGGANPFAEPEVRSNLQATYTLVEPNPAFTDADFRFTPPAGSKEVNATPKPAAGASKDRDAGSAPK